MSAQKSHFSAVPTRRGYPHSGEYPRASAAGGFSGRLQLNTRAEKGQAAMQNRQPMQRSLSISTIPSWRLNVAPTGHTRVQGGLSQ